MNTNHTAAARAALLAIALLPAAGTAVADEPPLQLLQEPVRSDQLQASSFRGPQLVSGAPATRVTAPPKPAAQTQIAPGVTFLHKEGSATQVSVARQRISGYRMQLDGTWVSTTAPVTTPTPVTPVTRPITVTPVTPVTPVVRPVTQSATPSPAGTLADSTATDAKPQPAAADDGARTNGRYGGGRRHGHRHDH